ncbi:MAG: hypothetical protein LBI26_00440 [Holosporales bacterium]|jgi:trigger factor|nr:hypothetical protein [Holosporales bacterium]
MRFENVKSKGMKHEYKVIFSAEDIENNIVKEVENRAKTFKMQGFRPGHVPLKIVRNSVESRVIKDVFDKLISNACDTIIKEIGAAELALRPTYKFNNSYEKGRDIEIALNIETAPVFELQEFKCKIKKLAPIISDEEFENIKKGLIKNNPVWHTENDQTVQPLNKVNFKAKCLVNGVEQKKKSFERTVILPENLGEEAKFGNELLGKKVGEIFTTQFSEDDSSYQITIASIEFPVLDISWDKYVEEKFETKATVAEYEELLRQDMKNQFDNVSFVYHKQQILDYLISQYSFELPISIVGQETKSVVANVRADIEAAKRDGTVDQEDRDKTDEDITQECQDVIRKRVLLGYVLNKFAKVNNITISDEELRRFIEFEIRMMSSEQAEHMIAHYSGDPNALAYKRAELLERKVLEFLIDKSEKEMLPKTFEEAQKIVEDVLKD